MEIKRYQFCKDCGNSGFEGNEVCPYCGAGNIVIMRDIHDTIAAMLAVIPGSDFELIRDIERVRKDAGYCPPEMMYRQWGFLGDVLAKHFGATEPSEGWQKAVVDILMDRSTQEQSDAA